MIYAPMIHIYEYVTVNKTIYSSNKYVILIDEELQ